MSKLIFFSFNQNKIQEVKKILNYNKLKLLTLNDFPIVNEPKEVGSSFSENAIIKSTFGFKKFGLPCFADDSGICISAINNKPGIKSKRFLEQNGGFKKTFEIIINEAKRKKNFDAYFQTTIALTIAENNTICFEGVVKGRIPDKPLGKRGFHYDPIFIPNGTKKTYAQMLIEEKNKISHRAIALNKLKKFLEKLFKQ